MIADTLILETDYKDSSKTGSIYKPIRELSRIFSSYQSDRITNYFFFDKIKFLKKYSRLNNLVLNLDDSNRKKIIDLVEIRNIKIFRRSTNEELLNQFTDFVMDYSIVDQKFKSFTYYGKDFTQYEQPIKYGKIIHLNRQETTDTAHSFQFVDFLNNCTFDNSFYYVVEIELEDKSLSFLDSYVSQFLAGYQNLKKIYNILRDNPFMINKDGSFLTGEIERSFQSFIELPGFSQDKKMIKFVNSHIRFALSSIAALTSLMSQNGENKYYDSIFNSINLRSGNYSNYPDVLNLFSKIETKLSRELNITGLSEFQFQSTTVRKNSKQEGRHTIRINSEVLTNPRSNVLLFDFLQNNSFNPEDLVFDKQSMLQNYDSYDLSTIKAKSFIFNTKRNILNSSANKGYNYDLAIIKNLKSLNLSTLVDLPISADNITNSIEQNESKILTDALASVGVTFSSTNLPEETSINESENPGFIATERTYNNGSDTTPGLKIASKNIMNSKFGGFGTSYAATLIGVGGTFTDTPSLLFQ